MHEKNGLFPRLSRPANVYRAPVVLPAALFLGALFLIFSPGAVRADDDDAADKSARVSYIDGKAFAAPRRDGDWKAVRVGDEVAVNRYFKTVEKSRAELTLPDGSVLRVASGTIIKISRLLFRDKKSRVFTVKLAAGRAWASVRSFFGVKSSFRLDMSNAVAGVRGTTFLAEVREDESSSISVYEGEVEVKAAPREVKGPKEGGAPRKVGGPKPIDGPRKVSVEEWIRIVGKNQRVVVSAAGTADKPTSFDPQETDDFIAWNLERDKASAK